MDIHEKLQQAGLTGNESKAYLELLKRGELSANQIAKNIGMDRTLAYTVLNHLIEKGQVNYIIKENKKVFSCSTPEALLNPIKAKETIVLDLIQELGKIKTEKQEPVEIKVYEGKEGLRTFINLGLKEKELLALGSTGRAFFQLYEMPAIAKQLIKSKVKVKLLGNESLRGTEPFSYKEFEYKYWDVESESTTTIFGDYVNIHLIKEKPIVIMIKNKDIAQSYKNYFYHIWNQIKDR